MRIFRGLEEAAAAELRHPVATLGVFDGLHLGHQLVVGRVLELARSGGGEAVVVTFGQHPRALLLGKAPKQITSLSHRFRLFDALGVDAVLVLHFDDELRATPAREFVRQVFVETLRAEAVVLGYNSRFGAGGSGDFAVLEEVAEEYGFAAHAVGQVVIEGRPVSSSEIRRAILDGDLDLAASMLGRPVSVFGTVVHGDERGRQIGFPTANLDLHHEVRPPRGVYGCRVRLADGREYDGVVNIGVRPTIGAAPGPPGPEGAGWAERDRDDKVEVHLLGFDGDLYRRDLEVVFLMRIRPERRFSSIDALREQIARDVAGFRAWRAASPPAGIR